MVAREPATEKAEHTKKPSSSRRTPWIELGDNTAVVERNINDNDDGEIVVYFNLNGEAALRRHMESSMTCSREHKILVALK